MGLVRFLNRESGLATFDARSRSFQDGKDDVTVWFQRGKLLAANIYPDDGDAYDVTYKCSELCSAT